MLVLNNKSQYKPADFRSANLFLSLKGGVGKTAEALLVAASHRINLKRKLMTDAQLENGGKVPPGVEATIDIEVANKIKNTGYIDCDKNLSDFYNAFALKDKDGSVLPESKQPSNIIKIDTSSASQRKAFVDVAYEDFMVLFYNIKADDTASIKALTDPKDIAEMISEAGYNAVNLWMPISSDRETLDSVNVFYEMFGNTVNYIASYNRHYMKADDPYSMEAVFKGKHKIPDYKSPYNELQSQGLLKEIVIPDLTHELYKDLRQARLNMSEVTKENMGPFNAGAISRVVNRFADQIIDII